MSLHVPQPDGNPHNDQETWTGKDDLSQDWHTYAVDWEPDRLVWYVDGVERWRISDASHIPAEPCTFCSTWPSEEP